MTRRSEQIIIFLTHPATSYFKTSDVEQLAVLSECAVCLVSENLLGKNLTKLNTFLIEAVNIPDESLEHDLILKMREKSAE